METSGKKKVLYCYCTYQMTIRRFNSSFLKFRYRVLSIKLTSLLTRYFQINFPFLRLQNQPKQRNITAPDIIIAHLNLTVIPFTISNIYSQLCHNYMTLYYNETMLVFEFKIHLPQIKLTLVSISK